MELQTQHDRGAARRDERREARRAANRSDILDAAELVFGRAGIRDGSLRAIAAEAGFSTAGLYLFFENKQHLLAETLTRRGDELNAVLTETAAEGTPPLVTLHRIIDATVAFFAARPHFRLLLAQIRGGTTITGPVLGEYAGEVNQRFTTAMDLLTRVVADGQLRGEVRIGDAGSLAHLYSVLVNEYVFLAAGETDDTGSGATLSPADFHALVDGALRAPQDPAA